MTAIAIELPADVRAARDGIVAFAEQEVIPRHERHRALFENPIAPDHTDHEKDRHQKEEQLLSKSKSAHGLHRGK